VTGVENQFSDAFSDAFDPPLTPPPLPGSIVAEMLTIAAKLVAQGVDATADPRSATPPCLLVEYPNLRWDVGCGATGEWSVIALAPGTANLDAVDTLQPLLAAAAAVLPVERADKVQYLLSPDNPPHPAYRLTFTQAVDL
jgi:hypothetical protein